LSTTEDEQQNTFKFITLKAFSKDKGQGIYM